jgi:hypothetical protein
LTGLPPAAWQLRLAVRAAKRWTDQLNLLDIGTKNLFNGK